MFFSCSISTNAITEAETLLFGKRFDIWGSCWCYWWFFSTISPLGFGATLHQDSLRDSGRSGGEGRKNEFPHTHTHLRRISRIPLLDESPESWRTSSGAGRCSDLRLLTLSPVTEIFIHFSRRTMCWCSAKNVLSSALLLLSLITPLPHFLLHFSAEMKDGHWESGGQALAQLSNHYRSSFSSSPPLTGHPSTGHRFWPLH